MSYQRLTPKEIEDLRAEMRAAGQQIKDEMARRRREHGETNAVVSMAIRSDPLAVISFDPPVIVS